MRACVRVCACVGAFTSALLHANVCVYICIRKCIYKYINIFIYLSIYMFIFIFIYIYIYVCCWFVFIILYMCIWLYMYCIYIYIVLHILNRVVCLYVSSTFRSIFAVSLVSSNMQKAQLPTTPWEASFRPSPASQGLWWWWTLVNLFAAGIRQHPKQGWTERNMCMYINI